MTSFPFDGSSAIGIMHYNDRIHYLMGQVRASDSCALCLLFHLPHAP
jgi:hypothetical protein